MDMLKIHRKTKGVKFKIIKTYILVFASILSFSVSGKSQESNYSYTESYEVKQPLTLTISSDSRDIEVIAHNESSIVVFYIVKKQYPVKVKQGEN